MASSDPENRPASASSKHEDDRVVAFGRSAKPMRVTPEQYDRLKTAQEEIQKDLIEAYEPDMSLDLSPDAGPASLKQLSPDEERIMVHKGTEAPGSGEYDKFYGQGVYNCRRCNTPLFKSNHKFDSGSGWPSFDQAIPGRVKETPDADGRRVEITCATCGAHLGHVFRGEHFTKADTRLCVNSLALKFDGDADKS